VDGEEEYEKEIYEPMQWVDPPDEKKVIDINSGDATIRRNCADNKVDDCFFLRKKNGVE
jgi:hypothetical protein